MKPLKRRKDNEEILTKYYIKYRTKFWWKKNQDIDFRKLLVNWYHLLLSGRVERDHVGLMFHPMKDVVYRTI